MTTNPKKYIELLEVFLVALERNAIDAEEIVKWADNIILNDSEPDYFIIELSLCGNKDVNQIISLINEYIWKDRSGVSARVILGFFYRYYGAKRISLKQLISSIYLVGSQLDLSNPEMEFIYEIDDFHDSTMWDGNGKIEDVEYKVLRFLEVYKEFRVDNCFDWRAIDLELESQVQGEIEIIRLECYRLRKQKQDKKTKAQVETVKWWKFWN